MRSNFWPSETSARTVTLLTQNVCALSALADNFAHIYKRRHGLSTVQFFYCGDRSSLVHLQFVFGTLTSQMFAFRTMKRLRPLLMFAENRQLTVLQSQPRKRRSHFGTDRREKCNCKPLARANYSYYAQASSIFHNKSGHSLDPPHFITESGCKHIFTTTSCFNLSVRLQDAPYGCAENNCASMLPYTISFGLRHSSTKPTCD